MKPIYESERRLQWPNTPHLVSRSGYELKHAIAEEEYLNSQFDRVFYIATRIKWKTWNS
jgi:hypothetical protein